MKNTPEVSLKNLMLHGETGDFFTEVSASKHQPACMALVCESTRISPSFPKPPAMLGGAALDLLADKRAPARVAWAVE